MPLRGSVDYSNRRDLDPHHFVGCDCRACLREPIGHPVLLVILMATIVVMLYVSQQCAPVARLNEGAIPPPPGASRVVPPQTLAYRYDLDSQQFTDTPVIPAFVSSARQIRMFKRRLGIDTMLTIVIPDDRHPTFTSNPAIEAFVVRNEDACTIRIRPEKYRSLTVLAHELCHCKNDFDYLTPLGWHEKVTVDEQGRRETEAWQCALTLLD